MKTKEADGSWLLFQSNKELYNITFQVVFSSQTSLTKVLGGEKDGNLFYFSFIFNSSNCWLSIEREREREKTLVAALSCHSSILLLLLECPESWTSKCRTNEDAIGIFFFLSFVFFLLLISIHSNDSWLSLSLSLSSSLT